METQPRNAATAWRFFTRAMALRCPVCGRSRIFIPLAQTRTVRDWFTPLDGCPRCGYAYEREPGYFLMSVWAINYGLGSVIGLGIYGVIAWRFPMPVGPLLLWVVGPVIAFCVLNARHSKALFIALDHFFDPHERDGGDDDGNRPATPPPLPDAPTERKPCEPAGLMR
jgi:uncharacterized protein (DUF983 family)